MLLRSALLFCLFFFLSAVGRAQLQKIYLHPKTEAKASQTKFVDSLKFIPLETPAGVSLGSNYNMNITSKFFLLINYTNKSMLFYSRDGKFVKQVSYKKLGENFYPSYRELTNQVVFFGNNKNYSLTPKDLVKIKLDWSNPRNRKYFRKYTIDLSDPTLAIKKEVPDEKDIVQIHHLYGDYYAQGQISVSSLYEDSVDYEFKLYKNNSLIKSFFPYNRISEPRFLYTQENISISRAGSTNAYFITRPYSDTIYKLTGEDVIPAYQLVLPLENSLPPGFYTKSFKNKTERENFNRNNGWVMRQVYSFYETPRFIYFLVGYLGNFDSYLYEKATSVTYKTKNVRADSSQFNLQLFQSFNVMTDGDKFYKTLKASDLLGFFEQNKNANIPEGLREFIKSKPDATAPVVVEFTLKN